MVFIAFNMRKLIEYMLIVEQNEKKERKKMVRTKTQIHFFHYGSNFERACESVVFDRSASIAHEHTTPYYKLVENTSTGIRHILHLCAFVWSMAVWFSSSKRRNKYLEFK